MKRNYHRLILCTIFLLIVAASTMNNFPSLQVQATVTSEETNRKYLNVISKFLYHGVSGKDEFDFNIKKEALTEGATYRWYIAKDKGNPYAVTIDSKTGKVTAQIAGTAYVGCKITLADQSVVQPEAKVIVINHVTEVRISNVPKEGFLALASSMDFNHKIINTTAGKGELSSDVVYWEIKDDTAGIGTATDDGTVIPKKVGTFSIRAVCFQNVDDYKSWLKNKKVKSSKITATSEWATFSVINTTGEAANQEQLDKLLADTKISQIIINSEVEQEITIPAGAYTDKLLILDAPNTDIINNGVFKLITIKTAYKTTWKEYAVGNSFEIYNSEINLQVAEKSQVKNVTFNLYSDPLVETGKAIPKYKVNEKSDIKNSATNSYIDLINTVTVTVSGKIDKIRITAATKLILTGSGNVNQLVLEEAADGTMLAAAIALDYVAHGDAILSVLEGAEAIKIKISENAFAIIENLSKASVGINFGSSNYILSGPSGAHQISRDGRSTFLGKTDVSSVVKFTPVTMYLVTASSITNGFTLTNSSLSGTFNYKGTVVEGVITWLTPNMVMNTSGYHPWVFIPTDTKHYDKVYGVAAVVVTP